MRALTDDEIVAIAKAAIEAHELRPGVRYLVVYDANLIGQSQGKVLCQALGRLGIKGFVMPAAGLPGLPAVQTIDL